MLLSFAQGILFFVPFFISFRRYELTPLVKTWRLHHRHQHSLQMDGNLFSDARLWSHVAMVLIWNSSNIFCFWYTGLFEMIVGVLTTSHIQYCALEIGVYVFVCVYLIEQHSKFLFYTLHIPDLKVESEPPLKPSPLTCYGQFGTN